jgi:RecA-family ATPase
VSLGTITSIDETDGYLNLRLADGRVLRVQGEGWEVEGVSWEYVSAEDARREALRRQGERFADRIATLCAKQREIDRWNALTADQQHAELDRVLRRREGFEAALAPFLDSIRRDLNRQVFA